MLSFRTKSVKEKQQQSLLRKQLLRDDAAEYASRKKDIIKSLTIDQHSLNRLSKLERKLHAKQHEEVEEFEAFFSENSSSDDDDSGES